MGLAWNAVQLDGVLQGWDNEAKRSAFWCLNELKNLVLPSILASLGHNAIHECYNLSSVNIPKDVTTIDETNFIRMF